MKATLYAISISHPARAAGLMLRHKGIDTRIVNLPPGSQQVALRGLGFRRGTVPALKIEGRRIQGSLEISRALEELAPQPPLYPTDPDQRVAVEDAERWGERAYQPVPRRIFRWAVTGDRELRTALARQTGIPAPGAASVLLWPVTQVYARLEGGGEAAARADVAALPDHLDRVDEMIAAETLNGEQLNAADFQIATTTRVLLNFPQIRPLVGRRPAAAHAMRVVPGLGEEVPVRLPPAWLPTPSASAAG